MQDARDRPGARRDLAVGEAGVGTDIGADFGPRIVAETLLAGPRGFDDQLGRIAQAVDADEASAAVGCQFGDGEPGGEDCLQRVVAAFDMGVERGFRADVVGCVAAARSGFAADLHDTAAAAGGQSAQTQRDTAADWEVVVQLVDAGHHLQSGTRLLDAERAVEVARPVAGCHHTRQHDVARDGRGLFDERPVEAGDGRRDGGRLRRASLRAEIRVVAAA